VGAGVGVNDVTGGAGVIGVLPEHPRVSHVAAQRTSAADERDGSLIDRLAMRGLQGTRTRRRLPAFPAGVPATGKAVADTPC
jgi:hypothetical protein